MGAYVRRFGSEPDEATLLAIESVVIVDQQPPAVVRGIGTGVVLVVGETEAGPFCVDSGATEILGEADYAAKLGGFGFNYAGVVSQHPCCRSRKADGATDPEFWNGSVFVAVRSCRFSRLFVARVDTSVGSVSFTRLAALIGKSSPSWDLEPGETAVLTVDGTDYTVTWDAAAATILSADGSFNTGFSGGEAISFQIDDVVYSGQFTSADQTHVQAIARLNTIAGFTAFTASSLKTRITGRIRGTAGNVQIISLDAAVATKLGFSAGSVVNGTGDVADIDKVTDAELNTRVAADTTNKAKVDRDYAGRIRFYSVTADGTGTIKLKSTSTATAFGITTDVTATAASGVKGKLPAGTRIQASGSGQLFVTMQSIDVSASSAGPYTVKVRHATDDQTGTSEIANAINTVPFPIQLGAFAVTNDLPVTAALTDAQIDVRYEAAIAKTRGIGSKVREVNIAFAARQSNAVRAAMKQNALDASARGCNGRVALIAPPLSTTTREIAMSDAQPGVGAYRDESVMYCFPGIVKRIPEIAAVGVSGGVGFTDTGLVDAHATAARAVLYSNLLPEEDAGQQTSGLVDFVLGIEANNPDVADLQLEDYIAFKAAGIGAFRVDGDVTLQSDVTSVDPALYPTLAPANRRRFANFYEDSIAIGLKLWIKKMGGVTNRALVMAQLNKFVTQLERTNRCAKGQVRGDASVGNTPDSLARNVFITDHKIVMNETFGVIEARVAVGTTVEITEK